MGHYEFKPLIYKNSIEKNKYVFIDDKLENGLVYLY